MYGEPLAKIASWLVFVAFNVTFVQMFLLGQEGMNRRVADYLPYLEPLNFTTSIAAFVLGAGFLLHLVNIVASWTRGPRAEANPWHGKTLEWETSSPPPRENFEIEPLVRADFYGYGEPGPEPEMLPLPGVRPRRQIEPVSTEAAPSRTAIDDGGEQ